MSYQNNFLNVFFFVILHIYRFIYINLSPKTSCWQIFLLSKVATSSWCRKTKTNCRNLTYFSYTEILQGLNFHLNFFTLRERDIHHSRLFKDKANCLNDFKLFWPMFSTVTGWCPLAVAGSRVVEWSDQRLALTGSVSWANQVWPKIVLCLMCVTLQ